MGYDQKPECRNIFQNYVLEGDVLERWKENVDGLIQFHNSFTSLSSYYNIVFEYDKYVIKRQWHMKMLATAGCNLRPFICCI
jgi:hypothetical protein